MSIDITTRTVEGGAVVAPHGDVDLTTSHLVREVIEQVIDDGARAVVLDLSDVGFMDSTALGVLVAVHRRLGSGFIVASAQPVVRRLFEITNFTAFLRQADSVASALTALRP